VSNLDTSEPSMILVLIFSQWHLFARVMPTLNVLKHFDEIKNTLGLRLLFRRSFS